MKDKVRSYIEKNNWSVGDVAKRSGIPKGTIKNIIYGKASDIRLNTLQKLAHVFSCSIYDLIEHADHPSPANAPYQHDWNSDLFKECIDAVESFCQTQNIHCNKDKMMELVNQVYSFTFKKRQSEPDYVIDADFIEWIIKQ